MPHLVILTRDSISTASASLPPPWSMSDPGVTRDRDGLSGPIGAWLDFYGIVRDWEAGSVDAGDAAASGTTDTTPIPAGGAATFRPADAPPTGVMPAKPVDARNIETRKISGIEYEAHEAMAQHQLEALVARIVERYPVEAMLVIHRIGLVPVGEPSLLVRILTPHRGEALRGCADFIDELKQWVPIWKHPQWM